MTLFANPFAFEWLWIAASLPLLALWAAWRRKRTLRKLADTSLLDRIAPGRRPWRRAACAFLATLASVATILGMARPQGDPIEQAATISGRDVAFLIDVSQSMLAEDVVPTRLDRSKLWIRDLVATLNGDRVALIAFAGSATVKCPLTLDYAFFEMALDDLSPRSVARGGTMIGDAIRKTLSEVLTEEAGRFRDIILITDGEDQESYPVQAAQLAEERNIRIIAIGVGSDGAPVPASRDRIGPEYVTYQGERVISGLKSQQLAEIAAASASGVYLNVGTDTLDLERVYADLVASAPRRVLDAQQTVAREELFQIPLLIALALLCVEGFIRDR